MNTLQTLRAAARLLVEFLIGFLIISRAVAWLLILLFNVIAPDAGYRDVFLTVIEFCVLCILLYARKMIGAGYALYWLWKVPGFIAGIRGMF